MDVAYDHIQEEVLSADEGTNATDATPRKDLNTEVREAYSAITASPWGAKLGGFFSQVRKQGESYYEGARHELTAASSEASKGLSDLVNQTKNLSLRPRATSNALTAEGASEETAATTESLPASIGKEATILLQQFGGFIKSSTTTSTTSTETTNTDIIKETDSFLQRFQSEATARLKQIQAAEDAADDALEKFGMNIKSFLRDAVTVAPPSLNADGTQKSTILFESKDAEGRRVVHATRFDAQLHVIHTTTSSFIQDPQSEEYAPWRQEFNAETKTGDIARDLEKYEELRKMMEKVVPEKVDYANFWARYYFLRHVIETEEQRRKELLQKTQHEEEVVKWDDDEDDAEVEKDKVATVPGREVTTESEVEGGDDGAKTPTIATGSEDSSNGDSLLKPAEPRRSNEHSVTDSDASYDILSGATSGAPGTPRGEEEKEISLKKPAKMAEEDDDDDWE